MPKETQPQAEQVTISLPPGMTKESFEKALVKAASAPAPEEDVIFARVSKTDKSELRVFVGHYKGKEQLRIQEWYSEKNDPTLKPGRGVTFHYEELDDLIAGLEKMKEWCDEHPRPERD